MKKRTAKLIRNKLKIASVIVGSIFVFSIVSWMKILLLPTDFQEFLSGMNDNGITYTERSLFWEATCCVAINSLGLLGSIFTFINELWGKRLLLLSFILLLSLNVAMLTTNIIYNRDISVFVMSIVIIVAALIMYKKACVNKKKIKTMKTI